MERTTAVGRTARTRRFPGIIAVVGGAMFTLFGAWAFLAPQSFFDAVARFEPYNAHLIRDLGAFQLGLGAVLVLAVVLQDALLVALAGVATGAVAHLVGHVIDRDLGGTPATDIPVFAVIAVALVAAALVRATGAEDPSRR